MVILKMLNSGKQETKNELLYMRERNNNSKKITLQMHQFV